MLLNRDFYTRERLLGLAITGAMVVLGHSVRLTYGQLYTAPFFVALVVIGNISGLYVAVSAALLFSIGIWMQWIEIDPARVYLDIICLLVIAYIVGTLRRKARVLDTINGNIEMLWGIGQSLDWLIRYWHSLPDKRKYERVIALHDMVVDLTTLALGWKKLAEMKDEIDSADRHITESDSGKKEV